MVGGIGRPSGIFDVGHMHYELRCLSAVVMQGCFSGTRVVTRETDGLWCVQAPLDGVLVVLVLGALALWNGSTTSRKAVDART